MIVTGIGNTGGVGVTTLMASLFEYLLSKDKDVYWISLSDLIPPLFYHDKSMWSVYESVVREVPQWDKLKCIFCDECQKSCNSGAIVRYGEMYVTYNELCISCGSCIYACKYQSVFWGSRKIGSIEQSLINNRVFKTNLKPKEILSSWHCKTIINILTKKLPHDAILLLDFLSGFRELWSDLINLSNKIIFYNNDLLSWEMLYKSISHDQAEIILAVNRNYYELFAERGYSFALSVPHTKEINIEAIQGKKITDEDYQQVIKDLTYLLNFD